MSGDACREWRGALAARALGRADPAADAALDAHLEGCPDCRADLDDLRGVAAALALADPTHLAPVGPDPALGDRVLERVARAADARRRRRRRVGAAVAAVAAAVVVAVAGTVTLVGDGGGTTGTRVELAGRAGVTGSATLVERAWGTEVGLEISGLDDGDMYWVWLSTADGERVVAGSLTGTGSDLRAVLASALPREQAHRVWMTDEDDSVVLDAVLE